MHQPLEGFSKLTKQDKIDLIASNYTSNPEQTKKLLAQYWNDDEKVQKLHDEFIENTLSNYYLPFSVAPNFLINDRLFAIPMAIEESSVVAAASKAAKFWLNRGGFKTKILGTEKIGQVHFLFNGHKRHLQAFFESVKPKLLANVQDVTKNMEKRGGGITNIKLRDLTYRVSNYYQLHCSFETMDAMGANFINSCLESFAKTLQNEATNYPDFKGGNSSIEVVMSILSNYVPNCLVRAEVSCPVTETKGATSISKSFAEKFVQAVDIAKVEPYRAVTHNKGVMNGIDAVVVATGNDFRAIEAGVHAYASRNGSYTSLTQADISNGLFTFSIEVPMALGTVGGLTSLHPLVNLALEILQKPSAKELMQIVAVAGLAQNFAALRSLVTTGIQRGHMKMHLMNMLNQIGASEQEKEQLIDHFSDKAVSNAAVQQALNKLRSR